MDKWVWIIRILYNKEVDKLEVISVYWENSKDTIVWEEIELYNFWDLVIEKEGSWSQNEAGFYKTKEISYKKATEIFWKKYNEMNNVLNIAGWLKIWKWGDLWGVLWFLFIVFFIWIKYISLIPTKYIFWVIILIIISIFYFIFKDRFWGRWKILLNWIFIIPLVSLISYFITNITLDNKKLISLENIDKWQKYELNFSDSSLKKTKVTWRTTYDYWGIRTYYSQIKWLKFSVKKEDDLKVIKKIIDIKKYNTFNNVNENIVEKMFNWIIYKLR